MPHKPRVAHRLSKLTVEGTSALVGAVTVTGAAALNGAVTLDLPVTPKTYTVATVPTAASYDGAIIHVSDGDTGSACLAVSDGTNWLRIALGAAVASS